MTFFLLLCFNCHVVSSFRLYSHYFCCIENCLICCRGEHGQDQDWISCRILAIFADQDWIWISIFEKNWIRTGSGYFLISITKCPGEWFKMSQMIVVVFSLLWFLFAQKIKIILSVCAALITNNDNNSCYLIFFHGSGSSYFYNAGMLLACVEWHAVAYVGVVLG